MLKSVGLREVRFGLVWLGSVFRVRLDHSLKASDFQNSVATELVFGEFYRLILLPRWIDTPC